MSRLNALLVLGSLVLIAGVLAAAYGIGMAIGQSGAVAEDAVARGPVGSELAFESTEPDLTVYLDVGGVFGDSDTQDRIAANVECVVTADGFRDAFSGARQGVSASIGDYASVGSFTLPGSSGRIKCSGSEARFAGGIPYLVTPHGSGEIAKSVGIIIGGVFVAIAGGFAAGVGFFRRRRAIRASGPPEATPF